MKMVYPVNCEKSSLGNPLDVSEENLNWLIANKTYSGFLNYI